MGTFAVTTVRTSWAAPVSYSAPKSSAPCFLNLAFERILRCQWTAITITAVNQLSDGPFPKLRRSVDRLQMSIYTA